MRKMRIIKRIFAILTFLSGVEASGQDRLFYAYKDSALLVQDANLIVSDFALRVNAIKPVMDSLPVAILNTKPFLIFYSPKANRVNLPIWCQVIPGQKKFFEELSGSFMNSEDMFGLFFNGFYLPHELAHALQHAKGKEESDLYNNEYTANAIAILYWRKVNRHKELERCYVYAKKVVKELPSPVPAGEDPVKYFNEHYAELGADPYKYGYYQFAQFVKLYDDNTLGSFEDYIRDYLQ